MPFHSIIGTVGQMRANPVLEETWKTWRTSSRVLTTRSALRPHSMVILRNTNATAMKTKTSIATTLRHYIWPDRPIVTPSGSSSLNIGQTFTNALTFAEDSEEPLHSPLDSSLNILSTKIVAII